MERTGAVVVLIVLAFLVASAASSNPMCCKDYLSWGSQNQINGCSLDQNSACNSWCETSCRGGECKFRSGHHKCHCYC
uniref:DEFL11-Defensin n=1 Tax=Saccharum hybrid cultivar SP80-3280 TaxID=193079 RepID=A0A2R4QN82_9POAL|nr:DEFL8 - Defensin [Saccharum hybrid cultivar SP80-3280]AVY91664.1 DEFL11 - Defensin [Saccharum hybrid cultivar SP80-3280]AVY91736.1 DEFL8 - Defensin [Saccharum hybrid cultivar SP80-3280]